MLFILLCSVPPADPPATAARTATIEFGALNRQAVDRLAMPGELARFHVELISSADTWGAWRHYEVQMRPGLEGSVWLAPGEDEDGADALVVVGRVRVIRQTDMGGAPFLEYRIVGARTVERR
jgi:hypothetical protein